MAQTYFKCDCGVKEDMAQTYFNCDCGVEEDMEQTDCNCDCGVGKKIRNRMNGFTKSLQWREKITAMLDCTNPNSPQEQTFLKRILLCIKNALIDNFVQNHMLKITLKT